MKTVKQLMEEYNFSIGASSKEESHLVELSKLGLVEETKLPLIQRALNIEPELMSIAEKNNLLELLDSLISHVLYEETKYGSKPKQRGFGDFNDRKTNFPDTRTQAPMVLIFKRKAIRSFPGNQMIGLYYSDVLDKFISIPFDDLANSSMGDHLNEASASMQRAKAKAVAKAARYKKFGDEQDKTAQQVLSPDEYKQHLKNRARDNAAAIRHDLISRTPARDLHKIPGAWKEVRDQEKAQVNTGSIMHNIAARAGIGLRHRIRNKFYKTLDKLDQKYNHPEHKPEPAAAPTPAPAPAPEKSENRTNTKVTAFKNSRKTPKPAKEPAPSAPADSHSEPMSQGEIAQSKKSYDKFKKAREASAHLNTVRTKGYEAGMKYHASKLAAAGQHVTPATDQNRRVGPRRGKPLSGVVRPPVVAEEQLNEFLTKYIGKAIGAARKFFGKKTQNDIDKKQKKNEQASNGAQKPDATPQKIDRTGITSSYGNRAAPNSSDRVNQRFTQKTFGVSQRPSPMNEMYQIVEEEMPRVVKIGNDDVTINSTIAKKVLMVYESLNRKNQKQMEKMLNESVDSFKKVINFSIVRQ